MRTGSRIPFCPRASYLVPPAVGSGHVPNLEAVWQSVATTSANPPAFERTSKRRKGFPSETRVKWGTRVVHGDKELLERLGRNDLCPCGSRLRFQALLPRQR